MSARSEKSDTEQQADHGSVGKFLFGLLVGVLASSGYIKWGWEKPALLDMPDQVAASVVAGTASTDLYDLSKPLDVRLRALEVIASRRPDEVLRVDAEELNYALLEAFYRRKARRHARQLSLQWSAYDVALEQPALRAVLEQRYGTTDSVALKQHMLMKAFRDEPFLAAWIRRSHGPIRSEDLLSVLHQVRAGVMSVAEVPPMVR